MRNLQAHAERLEKENHPAAALCRFLLAHSNSAAYLDDNLTEILNIIRCDLVNEAAYAARLMTALKNQG